MPDVEIRVATPEDEDAILRLLSASLGWEDDAEFREFYRWKHDRNPFGASARWVACDGSRVVGFRAFLRWELARGTDVLRAVRAVDTATDPEAQGQGVFRGLTLHGLAAMEAEGIDLVFNTPNDRSGPGYLAMGWSSVGRVRARVRPTSCSGLWRVARARGGASSRWSEPSTTGRDAAEVLADGVALSTLLASRGPTDRLRTAWTVDALRWRYAGAVPARAVVHPDGMTRGLAFVRVRRRGGTRIAVLGDVLVPQGDERAARALVRGIAREVDASGVAASGRVARARDGFLPTGARGPQLVTRRIVTEPPTDSDSWDLGYGDLELL